MAHAVVALLVILHYPDNPVGPEIFQAACFTMLDGHKDHRSGESDDICSGESDDIVSMTGFIDRRVVWLGELYGP